MIEITLSHMNEQTTKQLIKKTTGLGESEWESHQTWRAIRVNSDRILHSSKRLRMVIQCNPDHVWKMVDDLRRVPTQWPKYNGPQSRQKCRNANGGMDALSIRPARQTGDDAPLPKNRRPIRERKREVLPSLGEKCWMGMQSNARWWPI